MGKFSAWQRGQYDFMSIDNGVFDLGLRSVVVSPLRLQELTLRDVRLNIVTWHGESGVFGLDFPFLGGSFMYCNDYDEISVRFKLQTCWRIQIFAMPPLRHQHEDQHVDGTSNAKTIMD